MMVALQSMALVRLQRVSHMKHTLLQWLGDKYLDCSARVRSGFRCCQEVSVRNYMPLSLTKPGSMFLCL